MTKTPDPRESFGSSERMLMHALHCEQLSRQMSPADPARRVYASDVEWFLSAAAALESQGL